MRLLLFNLATDMDDPILGFGTRWICALAKRVEFIHVITMRTGRLEVPTNVRVHSVGKDKGYSELRRVFEFYRILIHILHEDHIDVCFSHMMPRFTLLAGPVLKVKRIPVVTWYAHPKVSWILRMAHCLSNRMVTSVSAAYPYKRDKLIVVGQGIDTDLFSPKFDVLPEEPAMIFCAGRLSPVKDHPTLLKAVGLLRQNYNQAFRVVILGGPATDRDESYVRSLRQQAKQLGLEGTVCFESPVPMERLAPWYQRSAIYVNMTPTGSGDKVVFEAMACGTPPVVANVGFTETLGNYADKLLYEFGDSEQLAEKLHRLLLLSRSERYEVGKYLRQQVVALHGLNRLAEGLVNIFNTLMSQRDRTDTGGAKEEEQLTPSDA